MKIEGSNFFEILLSDLVFSLISVIILYFIIPYKLAFIISASITSLIIFSLTIYFSWYTYVLNVDENTFEVKKRNKKTIKYNFESAQRIVFARPVANHQGRRIVFWLEKKYSIPVSDYELEEVKRLLLEKGFKNLYDGQLRKIQ